MSAARRAKSRFQRGMVSSVGWRASVCLWLAMIAGCEQGGSGRAGNVPFPKLPALQALEVEDGHAVVARGKLEPAQGMIAITGPVGDRLVRLDVAEGMSVKKGAILGELESLQTRRAELAVAKAQLAEAKLKFKTEADVANANLNVQRVALRQAELALSQAEMELESANARDGRLGLLQQQVQLATNALDKLREASKDPAAGSLVSAEVLDQKQLEVSQYQAELDAARTLAEQKIESGKLAVEGAKKEIEAVELSIASARASASCDSLVRQTELLELRIAATRLVSPLEGKVVSVGIAAGETTMGRPIMYITDTSTMVCRAEINVAELTRIQVGGNAKISGPALPRPLSGTVVTISQMIGSPRLPSADPLARVDWRSTIVVIAIDPEDNHQASQLINLHVDVAIEANPSNSASMSLSPHDSDR